MRELAATGHVWDGGTVTREPTVYSDGVRTYACSVCGEQRSETIPALPAQPEQGEETDSESGRGDQSTNKGELPKTGDSAFTALAPLASSVLLWSAGVAISATKKQRS